MSKNKRIFDRIQKGVIILLMIGLGVLTYKLASAGETDIIEAETIKPQYKIYNTVIPVQVQVFSTYQELNEHAAFIAELGGQKITLAPGERLAGFTYLSGNSVCIISVVETWMVDDLGNMAEWGHELKHCIYGNFHNKSGFTKK
jgi:hypothetical protein